MRVGGLPGVSESARGSERTGTAPAIDEPAAIIGFCLASDTGSVVDQGHAFGDKPGRFSEHKILLALPHRAPG